MLHINLVQILGKPKRTFPMIAFMHYFAMHRSLPGEGDRLLAWLFAILQRNNRKHTHTLTMHDIVRKLRQRTRVSYNKRRAPRAFCPGKRPWGFCLAPKCIFKTNGAVNPKVIHLESVCVCVFVSAFGSNPSRIPENIAFLEENDYLQTNISRGAKKEINKN